MKWVLFCIASTQKYSSWALDLVWLQPRSIFSANIKGHYIFQKSTMRTMRSGGILIVVATLALVNTINTDEVVSESTRDKRKTNAV